MASDTAPAAPRSRTTPLESIALVSILAATLTIASMAWAEHDMLPLVLLAGALVLPVVLFVSAQALVWSPRYAFPLAILIIVMQCATFRVRAIEDKSIDAQILMRLGCIVGMLALSVSAFLGGKLRYTTRDLAIGGATMLYLLANASIAVQPVASLVEVTSNIAVFLYLYAFHRLLGPRRLVGALIVGCFVLCCMSIVFYVADPLVGRMSDWVNGAFIPTSRLTGVFGTANAAGAAGAIGILLTALMSGISWRRPVFFLLTGPMAFCLVASNNRMSIAAMGAGFLYVYFRRGAVGLKLAAAILIGALAAIALASFGDTILSGVSRSGSVDEITSGTGRTRIWAVVLDLWMQRPLFGYGAGSAKFILPVHPLLFKAAAHAHNLYLNVLFAGGLVGFGLFMAGVVSATRAAWERALHPVMALILFLLIYGITEPTIGGIASFLSMTFYATLILPMSTARRASYPLRTPTCAEGSHCT
jgi:exopolysaccharide production protein ExoQ